MTFLWSELQKAGLRLLRAPRFAVGAVLTLALGIGATTAVFSVFDAIFLRPLPYSDPSRLYFFWEGFPGIEGGRLPIAPAAFHDWDEASRDVLQGLAGFRIKHANNNHPMTLAAGEAPRLVNVVTSTADLFSVLSVSAHLGRLFASDEDRQPSAVAVISYRLWQVDFAGDNLVLGRKITLDGQPFEIIGVLPQGFFFPPPISLLSRVRNLSSDIFIPLRLDLSNRGRRSIRSVARLGQGVSVEQAMQRLAPTAERLRREFPDQNPEGVHPLLVPLRDQAVGHVRGRVNLVAGAAILILMIACINVAGLVALQASVRRRELAVRRALGAGVGTIIRMLGIETLLLAVAGAAVGLPLAVGLLRLSTEIVRTQLPQLGEVSISHRVLFMSVAATVLSALAAGAFPILSALRSVPVEALHAGRSGASSGGHGFRQGLVVIQIAIAVVLLVGASLLLRSLWRLDGVDVGFDSEHVVAFRLGSPASSPSRQEGAALINASLAQLEALPEVQRAGAVSHLPLTGGLFAGKFEIEGRPPINDQEESGQRADYRAVSHGYFETMGIRLRKGRLVRETDEAPDSLQVVLIDQTLAERDWPDGDSIGSRISIDGTNWWTVVGVVEDIRDSSIEAPGAGMIYYPFTRGPRASLTAVVRGRGPEDRLISVVRDTVRRIRPEHAFEVQPLGSYRRKATAGYRTPALLLWIFGAAATLLASVGLYGIVSALVRDRTAEIGVRMALGAVGGDIVHWVSRRTLILVAAGLGLGLVAALAFSNLVSSRLYGVGRFDIVSYLAAAALLACVVVPAVLIPARRASRVDPIKAIRVE